MTPPADAKRAPRALSVAEFDAFYADALPVVFGYLQRLCGGDEERAWDLTQDAWLALVDQLNQGHHERATVAWLISVARSRFLDQWRRQQRLERKLRLVWSGERDAGSTDLSRSDVLAHLADLTEPHRVVLTLFYVDDLPADQVARLLGSSRSSTYTLLARAKDELRRRIEADRESDT